MFNYNTNFYSLAILIAIAIYHLMIFFGRAKLIDERYNFYFAVFALSLALKIFINSAILNDHTMNSASKRLISACLNFIISFGIINCLSAILCNKKNKLVFFSLTLFIPYLLYSLLLFYFKVEYDSPYKLLNFIFYYLPAFLFWTIFLTLIGFSFILIFYLGCMIKNKSYKPYNNLIIYLGFFFTISYIILQRLLFIFLPYGILSKYNMNIINNYFFIGLAAYLFVYGHAKKFNDEHNELFLLKENLAQIIFDRTIELKKAKEEIEVVSRQKSVFYINLTHEMKTPLTLINNYLARYINKKGLDTDLAVIKQNIEKLTRDMVNFLDSEKIERGEFCYNNNLTTDFSSLLQAKIELFKVSAQKKNININQSVNDKIFIKADPGALDRIIDNIIMNALKFTDENGIIDIKLKTENDKIIFTVNDSGCGIPEASIENIFKPFYQTSNNRMLSHGIGMGLFIVKRIIDMLEGNITVESKTDKGTVFKIFLKKYTPEADEKIEENAGSSIEYTTANLKTQDSVFDPEKNSILIVEDNMELLCYLQNELNTNYNIYTAENGKKALEKISIISKPDLIISDIMMAEMDGYEFLENIFKNKMLESIPFIFLTAKTNIDEKIKGLAKGALDYIYKPFSIEELNLKIESILSHLKRQRSINMAEAINAITDIIDFHGNKKTEKNGLKIFEEKSVSYKLTNREKEIILETYNGLEYKEIASKLNISTSTVIRHVQNIYEKLNVHNKIELLNILFKE